MPWTSSLLIAILFGVICGNHLLENHMRAVFAASVKNNAGNFINTGLRLRSNKVYKELPCPYFYDFDNNFIEDSPDCIPIEADNLDSAADIRRDIIMDTWQKYEPTENTIADNMNNIFAVDVPPPTLLEEPPPPPSTKTSSSKKLNTLNDNINFFTHNLLPASHRDFYDDLLLETNKEDVKRAGTASVIGCDCKIKNDLLDLGQQHFPRYLLNAVCQTEQSPNEYPPKCWRGAYCKPLEYKVKVLTFRTIMDYGQKDPTLAWLPDDLRQLWKFKTVTVAAGCFCSH